MQQISQNKGTIIGHKKIVPEIEWHGIDTVLLDMDGTLLDRHFDDYFWERHVPQVFAQKNSLGLEEARALLLKRYKKEEGSLAWTDLDFWSKELELDIPVLKIQLAHLIRVHPYVIDFLQAVKKVKKRLFLVTNAHYKTLSIKMDKTAISKHFDAVICAAEVGAAKEEPIFWKKLAKKLSINLGRTLLADDNDNVLYAAQKVGVKILIYVARPSSTLPVLFSPVFPSIEYFSEIIPHKG